MKKQKLALLVFLGFFTLSLMAQVDKFPVHTLAQVGPFRGTVKVLDINADGHMDVITWGEQNSPARTFQNGNITYLNCGDPNACTNPMGLIPNSIAVGGPFEMPVGTFFLDLKAGDINNDGLVDLFASAGQWQMSAPFINMGNNVFWWRYFGLDPDTEVRGQSAMADFNNDGKLDIVVVGDARDPNHIGRTAIFFNEGIYDSEKHGTTRKVLLDIPYKNSLTHPEVKVVDVNKDGYMDIWITGWNDRWDPRVMYTYLMINLGNETFMAVEGITAKANSSSDWADYDGDGFPDLVIMGDDGPTDFTVRIYKNNAGISLDLVQEINSYYPASIGGAVRFIDIDNDGDRDLIITGHRPDGLRQTHLYENTNGVFVKSDKLDHLPGYNEASIDFGDINNDGKLDIVMMGISGLNPHYFPTIVVENQLMETNRVPVVPTNLNVAKTDNQYTFSWDASSDYETPQAGLTYNVYVKNIVTGEFVLSPLSDITTGKRRVNEIGNAGSRLSKILTINGDVNNLEWGVQAVDFVYGASPFSEPRSVSIATTSQEEMSKTNVNILVNNNSVSFDGVSSCDVYFYNTSGQLLGKQSYNGTAIELPNNKGLLIVKVINNNSSNTFKILSNY